MKCAIPKTSYLWNCLAVFDINNDIIFGYICILLHYHLIFWQYILYMLYSSRILICTPYSDPTGKPCRAEPDYLEGGDRLAKGWTAALHYVWLTSKKSWLEVLVRFDTKLALSSYTLISSSKFTSKCWSAITTLSLDPFRDADFDDLDDLDLELDLDDDLLERDPLLLILLRERRLCFLLFFFFDKESSSSLSGIRVSDFLRSSLDWLRNLLPLATSSSRCKMSASSIGQPAVSKAFISTRRLFSKDIGSSPPILKIKDGHNSYLTEKHQCTPEYQVR